MPGILELLTHLWLLPAAVTSPGIFEPQLLAYITGFQDYCPN